MPSHKFSPELAYAVGLLTTDGNLSKDGRHICLRSSDKDLLRTFCNCLSLKTKIATTHSNGFSNNPSYRVQFSDVSFYQYLQKIGLTAAKTYNIGRVEIPDEFFRDFLRGHLDGDGTILSYIDKYNHYKDKIYINQRLYTKFISASSEHIAWLQKRVNKLLDVKGSISCNRPRRPNHVPIWVLKYAKKESSKLLKWIYYKNDLPCLKRKYEIAQKSLLSLDCP